MIKTAQISKCENYRYILGRQWDASKPLATFIMLNPSTADHEKDDPTIKKCIKFAERWQHGGLQVINLFALRTPSPAEMMKFPDPVGKKNKQNFIKAARLRNGRGKIICAWGNSGGHLGQDLVALKWIAEYFADTPHCLGLTESGQPKHPLARGKGFIPLDIQTRPYLGR